MATEPGDEIITLPTAARLLGLSRHAVYGLVESGELGRAETYGLTLTGRPRRRRSFHLTRRDVEEFIERARVKPGELAHLNPETQGRYRLEI